MVSHQSNIGYIMPIPTARSSQFFGKYGFVSRWSILIAGGALVAGVLIAYAWYLFVHHCAHHRPDKLPFPLLKHHQSHHKFATRNYGVSTTLWDHVFGTVLR
jgi:sterol desaturase/sphingolipid hydroxylase (fatty acid hydroxylase superfamily)